LNFFYISGGVGIACLQLAKAFGLKTIGTAGTESGLQVCFLFFVFFFIIILIEDLLIL